MMELTPQPPLLNEEKGKMCVFFETRKLGSRECQACWRVNGGALKLLSRANCPGIIRLQPKEKQTA